MFLPRIQGTVAAEFLVRITKGQSQVFPLQPTLSEDGSYIIPLGLKVQTVAHKTKGWKTLSEDHNTSSLSLVDKFCLASATTKDM